MDINEMLLARENRVRLIHELIKKHHKPVILVKANIPGDNKNIPEAYLLISLFRKEMLFSFHIHDMVSFSSADGPYMLLSMNDVIPIDLKKKLVHLEENHPLGRFIDLDLYVDETYSISRVELSLTSRRCYICDDDARICSKTKKHTTKALLKVIHTSVSSYMSDLIHKHIDYAMLRELNLEHKFGLVTPNSSGSHKDMDYQLMLKAKDVITPFFIEMFNLNYEVSDPKILFHKARLLGLIAEHQMLEKTQGVNAYKGLIFMLGISVLASGYVMMHGLTFNDLFLVIAHMTEGITDELKNVNHTHGSKAYHDAGLTGARGEVEKGLPTIKNILTHDKQVILDDDTLRDTLKLIILASEDTVLYHRAKNIDRYHEIKRILKDIDVKDIEQAKAFTKEMIEDDISFGGSADLLIVYLFIKDMSSYMNESTLSYG